MTLASGQPQRAMVSTGFQILGIGLVVMVTCILPQWKLSAFVGNDLVTAQVTWEGVWMTCTGQIQCKVNNSMLALSTDVKVSRPLVIISILLSIAGGKCTICVEDVCPCERHCQPHHPARRWDPPSSSARRRLPSSFWEADFSASTAPPKITSSAASNGSGWEEDEARRGGSVQPYPKKYNLNPSWDAPPPY